MQRPEAEERKPGSVRYFLRIDRDLGFELEGPGRLIGHRITLAGAVRVHPHLRFVERDAPASDRDVTKLPQVTAIEPRPSVQMLFLDGEVV